MSWVQHFEHELERCRINLVGRFLEKRVNSARRIDFPVGGATTAAVKDGQRPIGTLRRASVRPETSLPGAGFCATLQARPLCWKSRPIARSF